LITQLFNCPSTCEDWYQDINLTFQIFNHLCQTYISDIHIFNIDLIWFSDTHISIGGTMQSFIEDDNLSCYDIGFRIQISHYTWVEISLILLLIKKFMLIKKKKKSQYDLIRLLVLFLVNHMYPSHAIVETNPLQI
jgi:hypothetical protein